MAGGNPKLNWKALTVLVGVFVIGLLSGVLLGRLNPGLYGSMGKYDVPYRWGKSGGKNGRKVVRMLSEELNLSEEQRTQITPNITEARIKLLTIRLGSYKNAIKIISKLETQMKPFLEPKQFERLEDLTKKFRDHGKRQKEGIQRSIQSLQNGDTSR